jgi:sRNA-binding regulator protein Hfq
MRADRPTDETLPRHPAPPPAESETLLAGARPSALARALQPAERGGQGPLLERVLESRSFPFLRLLLYYALLTAAMALLAYYIPVVRSAFLSPGALPLEEGGTLAGPVGDYGARLSLEEALERAGVTLLVIAGALTLVVPVAWVYMLTKRFRYDPALVSSVIILPIVVAGIAMVVKNSIALAFALAGIVAAVRFRNTLKDPRDAVYIFLVIGIGLSAGVQALDVALVVSFAFNFVVLLVWRHNVGTIYSGRYARTGILSVGAPALLTTQEPDGQRALRRRMLEPAREIPTDGILLVHSRHPSLARNTVQEALADLARDWRLVDAVEREEGVVTLEYLVRLKKQATPADLVGSLDERWGEQVAAAEYVPFRTRKRKRKGKKEE